MDYKIDNDNQKHKLHYEKDFMSGQFWDLIKSNDAIQKPVKKLYLNIDHEDIILNTDLLVVREIIINGNVHGIVIKNQPFLDKLLIFGVCKHMEIANCANLTEINKYPPHLQYLQLPSNLFDIEKFSTIPEFLRINY